MRVLVTRPKEDSAALQRELRKRGIEVLLDPMLVIRRMEDAAIDLDGAQGLLFTSSNGARAFENISGERGLTVWCVGDETARTARAAGFTNVHSAAGNVDTLANYVIAHARPENGRLIHVAGSVNAGDEFYVCIRDGDSLLAVQIRVSGNWMALSDAPAGRSPLTNGASTDEV